MFMLLNGMNLVAVSVCSIFNTILEYILPENYSLIGYFPLFDNDTIPYCSCMLEKDCISASTVGIYETILERVPGDVYYDIQQPEYSVPGFRAACLPYNSLLASTLTCLYDTECLRHISKNNSWKPLHNFSNDTISSLINKLFVIEWINITNFTGYYHSCAPVSCSYSYRERLVLSYIISTFIGLISGILAGLRLITPLLVSIAQWIHTKWNVKKNPTDRPSISRTTDQSRGFIFE